MRRLNIENIRKPVADLYPVDVGLRCVEVMIPNHDGYLWILAAFVAILGNDWSWLGEKVERQSRAQLWQTAYAATLWDLCMKCEDLQECLQPFFDAIDARFDTIDAVQQEILDRINESQTVQPPVPVEVDGCNPANAYSGALAATEQVNLLISGIYKRAEVEAPDNFSEAVELLLSAIPIFETLPMDELFSLTQWVFDNQKAQYEADYVAEIEEHYWFEHAAGQLWCLVKDDCIINHEKIGMWLSSLAEIYPENYAAELFAKFGDATEPAMTNQIGELLNSLRGGQSLAEFFDDITVQFGVGAQSENPDYEWIDCTPLCEFEPVANDDPTETPFGQDSGIAVVSGSTYTITAGGVWNADGTDWTAEGNPGTFDPSAVKTDARVYSLMVKVDAGGAWYGGDELFNYVAPASGTLWFTMNGIPGDFDTYSGSLCIIVEIVP